MATTTVLSHKQVTIAWKQLQFNSKLETSLSEQLDNTRAELIQKIEKYIIVV